jgi:transcriptional regulator with XRE-family HTH domain
LRDSQQAFANQLGLSIRAVANYESDRTPTGRALVVLSKAAFGQGRTDLYRVFSGAVVAQIQVHSRFAPLRRSKAGGCTAT